jgi:hypothetical protein
MEHIKSELIYTYVNGGSILFGQPGYHRYHNQAEGWTNKELWFNSQQVQENFSLLQTVHTGSGAHPTSYSMGTEYCLPMGQAHGM